MVHLDDKESNLDMAIYFSFLICERNNARGCVSYTKYEWNPFSIAKLPEMEL